MWTSSLLRRSKPDWRSTAIGHASSWSWCWTATGRAAAADVRSCAEASAWAAFDALKRDDWRESARRLGLQEGSVGGQMVDSHRRRCPPARYWLGGGAGGRGGVLIGRG